MLPDTNEPSARTDPAAHAAGHRTSTTPAGVAALPNGPDRDDRLAELYAWPDTTDRPFVRANMIASLDGGTTVEGRSAGLGNPQDEHLFTLLRDLAEVILVGAGTVRAERYGGIRLDAERAARRERWGLPVTPPPIAVVTARGLDPQSPLFTDTETPPIVITTERAAGLVPDGVLVITAGVDRVSPRAAVNALGADGYRRVQCEGGPALLAALIDADLVDECCLTIAPLLLGTGGTPLLPMRVDDAVRWELAAVRVGDNHLFTRYHRTAPASR